MITKVMTKSSKVNQRMSSRYSRRNQEQIQDSRGKLKNTSRFKRKVDFKNQESRFKDQASKNQDQDSRLKIQESREDLIKISIKKFFKTLSSTRRFHKIITKEFYSPVIDFQNVVINYQWF